MNTKTAKTTMAPPDIRQRYDDDTTAMAWRFVAEKSWGSVYCELFKARLNFLVLLTTMTGFYLGSRAQVPWRLMLETVLGTALMAGGASALNQLWEQKHDAKMRRTRERPLPSGRLRRVTVLGVGAACALLGLVYLIMTANLATGLLGAVTLVTYVFVYTPLKRLTSLNTAVGAVAGALPSLLGWTAAQGQLSGKGWVLFAILALWQLPHFMAIAWIYRDDYNSAGFRMLPSLDPQGRLTGLAAFTTSLALLPTALCPSLLKLTGLVYFLGALGLSLIFLWYVVRFWHAPTEPRARRLFLASLAYLPLLLALMVLDKL
jgi:protoheme IX farnesyltransferase